MAPRINPVQKQKFFRKLREGWTIKEASEYAGFSNASGKGLSRNGRPSENGLYSMPETEKSGFGAPKSYEQMSPEARKAFDDFGYFRHRLFGRRSTPWQEESAHTLVRLLESPEEEYCVLNCPPGTGKTTMFSHDFPAWLTARDRTLRGLLGSHGKIISESLVGNLRDSLARRTPIQARHLDKKRGWAFDAESTMGQDFGTFRPDAGELWRRAIFTVAQPGGTPTAEKESTWVAFSYEAKFLGWRVNFINWDDLVTPAMLRNQDTVDAMYEWYDDEAETRLEPGGLLVVVGQRLRRNDIYRYCLDKRLTFEIDEGDNDDPVGAPQKYVHIVYKAHDEENCKGLHKATDPSYPEGCLLDPVRAGWKRVRAAKDAGHFDTVWQQEDSDPTKVLVRRVWIDGGTDIDGAHYEGCWDKERAIGQLPEIPPGAYSIRYMTVDPSPTKFWSVQDWLYVLAEGAPEPLTGYRYLINFYRGRMPINEFLQPDESGQQYEGLAEDWVQAAKLQGHPISYFIMEKNAAQRWAMQYRWFHKWSNTRGLSVIEHETTRNKSDPELGIWATLPPAYRYNRVRLPGHRESASRMVVKPLVDEVTLYPDAPTDDAVMSEWFGEFKLQDIVGTNMEVGTLYPDMPSWIVRGPRLPHNPLLRDMIQRQNEGILIGQ